MIDTPKKRKAPPKIECRVPVSSRVKPDVMKEIRRLAKRAGERPSEYIATVLEAHTEGQAHCPLCDTTHNFHREDHL